MYAECVCGYAQVWYRNVEGDWRVGDVSMVRVLLSRLNAVYMRNNFDVMG